MCYSYAALWRRISWVLLVGWPLKTLSTVANFKPCREVAVRKYFHSHEVIFVHCEILCRNAGRSPAELVFALHYMSASGPCVVYHLFFHKLDGRCRTDSWLVWTIHVPSSLGQILYFGKDSPHAVSVPLEGGCFLAVYLF